MFILGGNSSIGSNLRRVDKKHFFSSSSFSKEPIKNGIEFNLMRDSCEDFVKNNFNISDDNIKDKIHVINYSEGSITIECDSSSVGSILKFEREKYLEIFKNYGLYNIQDLKIKIK